MLTSDIEAIVRFLTDRGFPVESLRLTDQALEISIRVLLANDVTSAVECE